RRRRRLVAHAGTARSGRTAPPAQTRHQHPRRPDDRAVRRVPRRLHRRPRPTRQHLRPRYPAVSVGGVQPVRRDLGARLRVLPPESHLHPIRRTRRNPGGHREQGGRRMTGDADYLAIAICSAVISLTLWVTFATARRAKSADGFFAAGRSISSWQNGFAIAGEFISAGSFLGTTGLIFSKGVDGTVILFTSVISFLPVLFLLAEKMRNLGKYTLADVLVFRTDSRNVRVAVARSTTATGTFVLLAQLVAAGVLLESVSGIPFWLSVVVAGSLMGIYVFVGGMLATTWAQVIKSSILSVLAIIVCFGILAQFGFAFPKVLDAATDNAVAGDAILSPGLIFGQTSAINLVSYALAFALGTAGMAHFLIRFFSVPEATTARRSRGWIVALCSLFYLIVIVMGFGAAAVLGPNGTDLVGPGGNLAAPVLVPELGGCAGSIGGTLAPAPISAVAFDYLIVGAVRLLT